LSKVSFALVIHAHQPVGNFDYVIEEAYQKSYAPFVRSLLNHPKIRLSLHFSGILLEWLEKHHPGYFEQLEKLAERGQVEFVGGGYYEPILPAIPYVDKIAQLHKLADYIKLRFGEAPRGAWVTERVWEPTLPGPLVEAGVEYVVLDDTHFLAAGLEPTQLRGAYITEDEGSPLYLIPSLKIFRYTIPFREPEETLGVLREGIGQPGILFAMGDDCEKFGVWPGTYDHVFTHGWLERFFRAIEDSEDWLESTTVSGYLASHTPVGRVYLPTASYEEMSEWALPTTASTAFKACLEESQHIPGGERFLRFLRGGMWRNFLSKYSEANQIHKYMLTLSRRWQQASHDGSQKPETSALLADAQSHLLAGQCNDPYWHGVFGGLYAPHLRSAVIRHLIQAESLLDQMEGKSKSKARILAADFDVDGHEEILVSQQAGAMVVCPADGGTVSSLRFKPADAELINSLMRRPEPYHELVRKHVASKEAPREGPASIHDMVLSKETHLEALLRYDRYARHAFRTYVFPADKNWKDFDYLRLEESETLAKGPWQATQVKAAAPTFELHNEAKIHSNGCDLRVDALKTLVSNVSGPVWRLECRSSLSTDLSCPAGLALGLEMVLNLLAPDAPDRFILANEVRRPLEFRGEIDAPSLQLVDEWQRIRIRLEGRPGPRWWIVPVQTISQSESGVERVYQGSAIMAVWKIESPAWRNITCTLRTEIAPWTPISEPKGSAR
jgi:hypothetical protein